ncbi:MAG TPA: insulinase family protein, partial [Cyclobacteriaceae bacterium]|nr:insulinase family protein [Cyclobacteriaceae bacterium]
MKNNFLLLIIICIGVFCFSCTKSKYTIKTSTDPNGFVYETVTNDPIGVRLYKLKNGLEVYFTVIKDAPRIQTLISVKAGSLHDPEQTTGLAHYFEHIMFKGTSHFGTTDWEKEQVLLNQISDLFEKRRAATDSLEKAGIYRQIDSVSQLAAKYSIANEYDKLMSAIGGQGTNAFTTYQGTTYMEDIPSNEIERWLGLQFERFSNFSMRLFHTELETVYEEFNMAQDQDGWRLYSTMLAGLWPHHPLGRSVIGLPEHLKNPSMVNIMNFYRSYYVPNNMAIIMSGDFDMDTTIKLINNTFGQLPPGDFEKPHLPSEEPITEVITREVYGPEAENLAFAFRFGGDSTEDKKYVTLINYILSNYAAGLIDLNLVQQQKIQNGGCGMNFFKDYGYHEFWGQPREGQSLEEVAGLLLGEIDRIKKGEFEDWLIKAVINDLKLQTIRGQDSYQNRAFEIVFNYMNESKYIENVKFLDELEKIHREDLIRFANENYKDNYVIVYKRRGEARDIIKVPKPEITPVEINRTELSSWYSEFIANKPETKIKPVYIDFNVDLQQRELKSGIDLFYIPNKSNDLFDLMYVIDMGKSHSKKLALAVAYLQYVGTDQFTPAQVQQEFFKLGLRFDVFTGDERSYVMLSGLNESLEKGAALLEHLLTHAQGDSASYFKCVDKILKDRANNKLNHNFILHVALSNYGRYGSSSSFTDILREQEMRSVDPVELTAILKDMCTYKHRIVYYGKSDINTAVDVLSRQHPLPEKVMEYPDPVIYPEADFKSSLTYFINYDMVQTNMRLLNKISIFDVELMPYVEMYNDYYGTIVFQEIREARGLAYSA